MKIIADNQIIKLLAHNPTRIVSNPLLSDPNNHISFRWPSLLEYLDLGSILTSLPPFDPIQPLYKAYIKNLSESEEKELLHYLYDSLFTFCLNQIKDIPQISDSFLLSAIQASRQKPSFSEIEKLISSTLDAYEKALVEKRTHTMHDLILYLAWDRMCVCIARLFDYQTTDPKFIKSLGVLKDCLIESYIHIFQQGRTLPSLYRLVEALFFYEIREENLQKHSADAWTSLSKSFQVLKGQEELPDFFYIDDAFLPADIDGYLTLDSPDRVNARIALAHYMVSKLHTEVPQWGYVMHSKKIMYLAKI